VEVQLVFEGLADVAGFACRARLDEGEDVVFGTVRGGEDLALATLFAPAAHLRKQGDSAMLTWDLFANPFPW